VAAERARGSRLDGMQLFFVLEHPREKLALTAGDHTPIRFRRRLDA